MKMCVLLKRQSLFWDCVAFEGYLYVFVCLFFILLYIDSTACVDLVYFSLFDMKNVLMACMKPTLHICNIHQCIIEDNVCV